MQILVISNYCDIVWYTFCILHGEFSMMILYRSHCQCFRHCGVRQQSQLPQPDTSAVPNNKRKKPHISSIVYAGKYSVRSENLRWNDVVIEIEENAYLSTVVPSISHRHYIAHHIPQFVHPDGELYRFYFILISRVAHTKISEKFGSKLCQTENCFKLKILLFALINKKENTKCHYCLLCIIAASLISPLQRKHLQL